MCRFNVKMSVSQSKMREKSPFKWKTMCGCFNLHLCGKPVKKNGYAEEDILSSIYWKAVLRRRLMKQKSQEDKKHIYFKESRKIYKNIWLQIISFS